MMSTSDFDGTYKNCGVVGKYLLILSRVVAGIYKVKKC